MDTRQCVRHVARSCIRGISAFFLCLFLTAAAYAAPAPTPPLKVVYGFDREFAPYSFELPGGKPTGFEVELVEAIFRGRHVNLQFRPLDWDMVMLELSGGQISLATGMVRTKQRMSMFLFSDQPTIPGNIRFFAKNRNRVGNNTLLRGQAVSVEKGSYALRLMEQMGGLIIRQYNSKTDAVRALYNDEVIAYCGPEQNAYHTLRRLKFTGISALGTPLSLSNMYIAVNKDKTDVLDMVNKGMRELVQTGEYERLFRKWFVVELADADVQMLVEAAEKAAVTAYAPYSGKGTGAAVLTMTGDVFTGSNIENAQPAQNLSALRVALGKAASAGNMEIRGMVTVDANGAILPPSAEDRQTAYEFNRGALFIIETGKGIRETRMAGELLPVTALPVSDEALAE